MKKCAIEGCETDISDLNKKRRYCDPHRIQVLLGEIKKAPPPDKPCKQCGQRQFTFSCGGLCSICTHYNHSYVDCAIRIYGTNHEVKRFPIAPREIPTAGFLCNLRWNALDREGLNWPTELKTVETKLIERYHDSAIVYVQTYDRLCETLDVGLYFSRMMSL